MSATAAVGLTAACGPAAEPPEIPDEGLTEALQAALGLRDAAERLGLEEVASDHTAHIETLNRILAGPEPEPTAVEALDDAALAEAESEHADLAAEAALSAEEGYAVLLSEIAACRGAHVETLRTT